MKNKFLSILALTLAFDAMKAGADDPATLNNFWKVAQEKIDNFAQNRRPSIILNPGLVAFLLSDRNRQSGDFNILEVKEDLEMMNADGKKGYVAVVKWMPPLQMSQVAGGDGVKCATSGVRQTYKKHPFKINRKFTSQPVEIDNGLIRCIQEGKGEYTADSMYNFLRAVVSQWAAEVENEVMTVSNGYIGKFPDRFKGTVSTDPCKQLNLFRDPTTAYNQLNFLGEKHFKDDMKRAGVPDYVLIGGTRLTDYAELKSISVPNDNASFDPSQMPAISEANVIYDSYIEDVSACENPMLALRPGALQIVTFQENVGDFVYNGNTHKRGTLVDPFFGLTWDIYSTTDECGDEIKEFMFAQLHWGVFGYPDCPYQDDPLRQDVNDVFLYSIQCGDTPVCSEPVDKHSVESFVKPVTACDEDEVCAPTCKLTLNANLLPNGDYQVIAIAAPSLGATIDTWAWEVNGAPVATPTPEYLLTVAQGTYLNGETIELTVTDSEGCTANGTLIIEVPVLEVEADGNAAPDGGTFDFGNVVQATGQIAPITLLNTGSLDLTASTITIGGDVKAGFVLPTLPLTVIEGGTSAAFDVEFDNGSLGLKTITIVVASNDPATPSYSTSITVTFT